MFKFDLEKSKIFQAIRWRMHPVFGNCHFLKRIFIIIFVIFLFLFIVGFFNDGLNDDSLRSLLGFCILNLVLGVLFSLLETFFSSELTQPDIEKTPKDFLELTSSDQENYNLASLLSFPSARAVFYSIKWAKTYGSSEVDSYSVFYFLLKQNAELNFIFFRILLNPKDLKKALLKYLKEKIKKGVAGQGEKQLSLSDDFYNSLTEALNIAAEKNHSRIEIGDLISGLAKHNSFFKELLINSKLKPEDIKNLASWIENLKTEIREEKKWWEYKNLARRGTMGKGFSSGYTVTLDSFSIDWSEILRKSNFYPIFGHKQELEMVERILSRQQINNVLLVGKPGTGKKSIVTQFARRSFLGESLPEINYKRVVELDLPGLISRIQDTEELESALDNIFKEAVFSGNVILVIPNIHDYIGITVKPGVVDISGILYSYLDLPNFQIVGTASFAGFRQNIERKPAILNFFEKVRVSEVSPQDTLAILEGLVPAMERKYRKYISYPALRDIIEYADRYLPALPFPKKAQDILNESVVLISRSGEKVLMPKHISKIVSDKSKIPVGEMESKEKEILLNLESLIHKKIINQDSAVKEISAALRRARTEVKTRNAPMGSFLFLGPTGVGKTETSKALAEIYFGSKENMIRLDMSEFQQLKDVSRIIGSKEEDGFLTTKVRENPFSLVLLDEVEKTYPDILNLFLQILDEGYVTDGLDRKVDFRNTIIIATSNAGYKIILDSIAKKIEWNLVKKTLLDSLFDEGIFRPELINRFDAVIVFSPLSRDNLLDICHLQLQGLEKNLLKKDIEFIITEPLKDEIVKLSYNPQYGAREMKRVIQDKIENVLAEALLEGKIERGSKIKIDARSFEVIVL